MTQMLVNLVSCPLDVNLVPTLNKCHYFQKWGINITFLCSHNLKKRIVSQKLTQSPHFLFPSSCRENKNLPAFIFEAVRRNFSALKFLNKKFDIVYSPSSVLDLVFFPFIYRLFHHAHWVSTYDNHVSPKSSPFLACFFHQISLLLLKKADHLFIPTSQLKKDLIKKNFSLQKLSLAGNAIESNLIKKAKGKKYLYNAIFLGRINKTKGINDLLQIADHIKNIAVIGAGDQALEKKLKAHPNIKFLGPQFGLKKFQLLKSSHVFIFPSYAESFGIALLEAVCCGLPAITYQLPVYKHLYKNQEIIAIPKGNIKTMIKKIKQILKNPKKNIAGQKLLNQYSWNKIAQIEINIIKKFTHDKA